MQEMWVQSLGQEDALEKEMATHSSILCWEIPWIEEPGGLQSMGSQKNWKWLSDKQQQQTTPLHVEEDLHFQLVGAFPFCSAVNFYLINPLFWKGKI